MSDDLWVKNEKTNIHKHEFEKLYLNEWKPQTFLEWLEDFCNQLDCPPPEPHSNDIEFFKRVGAWETQMLILKKLRYAVESEKQNIKK